MPAVPTTKSAHVRSSQSTTFRPFEGVGSAVAPSAAAVVESVAALESVAAVSDVEGGTIAAMLVEASEADGLFADGDGPVALDATAAGGTPFAAALDGDAARLDAGGLLTDAGWLGSLVWVGGAGVVEAGGGPAAVMANDATTSLCPRSSVHSTGNGGPWEPLEP